MRATRLIYVENDPALRGIMTRAFEAAPDIELLLSAGTAAEALSCEELGQADAALLDLALGAGEVSGLDLGVAIRERNADIGIVVYSQFSMRNLSRQVPPEQSMGWSFVPKSGDMDIDELIAVIRATAQGMSHDFAGTDAAPTGMAVLDALSSRQRAVMALAATGLTAPEMAKRLGMTHDAVRRDLSRAYRLLVPEGEGQDLRTLAVLAYLDIMRNATWSEGRK